eukprot:2938121-Pyramimonas_sp.AAC.2
MDTSTTRNLSESVFCSNSPQGKMSAEAKETPSTKRNVLSVKDSVHRPSGAARLHATTPATRHSGQ